MTDRFRPGLYDEDFERDACGIGLVARPDGRADRLTVTRALEILTNLAHRGAVGGDRRTSDGAGILTQIPIAMLTREMGLAGPSTDRELAVGQIFFPRDPDSRASLEARFTRLAEKFGFEVLGWRTVPTDSTSLGDLAAALEPVVRQVVLTSRWPDEQGLYRLRKRAEEELRSTSRTRDPVTGQSLTQFYVCSLSHHTIVYKGLIGPGELSSYYPDLARGDFKSAFAMVHSRFSTNTLPAWELAQPFRKICHNGEINTIRGNTSWMRAREALRPEQAPFIPPGLSDSAALDRAVELLTLNGRSLTEALVALVPKAWESNASLSDEAVAFYRYHAPRLEPWDGPAAVCFADGRFTGAKLDRSGLRPCRYSILNDGSLVLASETGALRLPPNEIASRGRLGPGQIIAVDFERNQILFDRALEQTMATQRPYTEWLRQEIAECGFETTSPSPDENSRQRLRLFGYTDEEIKMVLMPMFSDSEEPSSSMGNDTPLAVLSDRPQRLSRYFRQLFAQVTNPPIDPIREKLVMSLSTYLGARPSPFTLGPSNKRNVRLLHPILASERFAWISGSDAPFSTRALDLTFEVEGGEAAFMARLSSLCDEAARAASQGAEILILTDRGVNEKRAALPSLLAASALHHTLLRSSSRTRLSLVVETADARDVHDLACLIGYGVDAIHPYAVYDLADELARDGRIKDADLAKRNYREAAGKGLLTIISKMGISAIQSYCGAQVFEIIGLGNEVVDGYFDGTPSRVGGLGLKEIARETLLRHGEGLPRENSEAQSLGLPSDGIIHFRAGGEAHYWNPSTIANLQIATRNKDRDAYRRFADESDRLTAGTLRGHLTLKPTRAPVPLEEVESAASLVKRFTTGAMSFGSLSPEAHETLALAMNRIGAKSNSGEGGEGDERFAKLENGDSKNSSIKQIASGRFGVTAHYLVSADEIQIKIAQGAKPGEGGKLPGHKVNDQIAKLRFSIPGVTLISPPPHHDIYSIEDLKQLIHDLRKANPRAAISVKLVAAAGVGTIAAGVAKAGADKILISGDGGGTGASPLSSIKCAGSPWELGLAEVHQTLVMQGLRGNVRVETDGQLKTGRDVAIATLLGAEEFGFSTAPLIAQGCVMMRKCHLNTCPVGVATQDPELRKKFTGAPEHVIEYFFAVAEDLRAIMSSLGFKTLQDMIGRRESLAMTPSTHWKARTLDLRSLLITPTSIIPNVKTVHRHMELKKIETAHDIDDSLIEACSESLYAKYPTRNRFKVANIHHAIGTKLSSEIARRYGSRGLPDETIILDLDGTCGQSLGAFLSRGITLRLNGDANDYVGKGLSGGRIIVNPPWTDPDATGQVVSGNACLYGATSGKAFFRGRVGERFAVRNSGAVAVVEGTGDHACEYMTGGEVVVLGETGRNFAAGMSGGHAYVYDREQRLKEKIGSASAVELTQLEDSGRELELRRLIELHAYETGSIIARVILNDWANAMRAFVVVTPLEYKTALLSEQKKKLQRILMHERAPLYG